MNRWRHLTVETLYALADALTPSPLEHALTTKVAADLCDAITMSMGNRRASIKLIGSTASDTALAGTCDIDAFVNFPSLPDDATMISAFRAVVSALYAASSRECGFEQPVVRTYAPPRVAVKTNFRFLAYRISLAGIRCTRPAERVESIPEDIYYHPDLARNDACWRREVRAMKVLRRATGLEGRMSGIVCELAVSHCGSVRRVIEQIAADAFVLDVLGVGEKRPSPYVCYPRCGKGNLMSRVPPASWKRLVRLCGSMSGGCE